MFRHERSSANIKLCGIHTARVHASRGRGNRLHLWLRGLLTLWLGLLLGRWWLERLLSSRGWRRTLPLVCHDPSNVTMVLLVVLLVLLLLMMKVMDGLWEAVSHTLHTLRNNKLGLRDHLHVETLRN